MRGWAVGYMGRWDRMWGFPIRVRGRCRPASQPARSTSRTSPVSPAAPVQTVSWRPRMGRRVPPRVLSIAATKCISEVPGLAKQTSMPASTAARSRRSAPVGPAAAAVVAIPAHKRCSGRGAAHAGGGAGRRKGAEGSRRADAREVLESGSDAGDKYVRFIFIRTKRGCLCARRQHTVLRAAPRTKIQASSLRAHALALEQPAIAHQCVPGLPCRHHLCGGRQLPRSLTVWSLEASPRFITGSGAAGARGNPRKTLPGELRLDAVVPSFVRCSPLGPA